jgi:hypothetical protein
LRRALLGALLAALPSAALAQGSLLDQGKSLLNEVQKGNRPSNGGMGSGSSAGAGAALPQAEIGSGLKDALKVASRRVVGPSRQDRRLFGRRRHSFARSG